MMETLGSDEAEPAAKLLSMKISTFPSLKKTLLSLKNFSVFEKKLLEKTNLSQSAKLLSIKISTFASLKKTFCPRQKVLSSPAFQ